MNKPIQLEQQGCDAPVRLHVGYVGITREGKRVEIITNDGSNAYQWESDEYDWYMTSGNFWSNGKEDEEDIIGPWVETPVEPPVDYKSHSDAALPCYNDGKWHRWAGGECPVHPSNVVQIKYLHNNCISDLETDAIDFHWDSVHAPIIAFRVTKVHVEPPKVPREFWVPKATAESFYERKPADTTRYIHVREVLTDD
jgi:hypothetical protein